MLRREKKQKKKTTTPFSLSFININYHAQNQGNKETKKKEYFCFFLLFREQIQVLGSRKKKKKVNSRNQRKLYPIHKIRFTRKKHNNFLEIKSIRAKKKQNESPKQHPRRRGE